MTPSDDQGPRDDRGPEAHEDDPTGIRALLSSLPEPGPMPADLVGRIEARLAVEQAHREQQGSTAGAGLHPDTVVDLAAERSSRRPGRTVALLGVAAAGLLVATVTIGELAGVGPAAGPAFDSAAQVPGRASADSGDQAGADSAGGAGDEGTDAEAGAVPGQGGDGGSDLDGDDAAVATEETAEVMGGASVGEVALLGPLGVVTAQDYPERAVEALALLDGPRSAAEGSLTLVGAQACWDSLVPERPWGELGAAQAELDGDRVVVLLGTDAGARDGQAAVLPWSCTTGELVEPVHTTSWPAP